MKRLTFVLCAVLLLAVAPAPLAPPAMAAAPVRAMREPSLPDPRTAPSPQRLQALIARVKLEQQHLHTLQARFVQHRESSLLVSPEESNGEFSYAAPDRVRWEYLKPNPISVVIDHGEMITWYRDLGRAERVKIGRYSNQIFKYLGASGSMQTLLDYFNVALHVPDDRAEPYRLDLVPRYSRIAKHLKSMNLWIDPLRYFPTRLRYVEGDGDVTEYEFKDVKVNPPIPGDRFVLKLPDGVETRVIDLDPKTRSKANPGR
ncbi:MAG TPA: outer membrane lipoprotein carrier protein LolA [Thermoanaerobaculia bacterium]|nr:outer membrane lipoprotein carrier protein LolA [Thermoanaerobaculia bacterium]